MLRSVFFSLVSFFYGILSAGLNEDGHIFFSIFLYKCREKNIYRTAAEHEVKPESSDGPCSVTATAVYKTLGTLTKVDGSFCIGCFDSWI